MIIWNLTIIILTVFATPPQVQYMVSIFLLSRQPRRDEICKFLIEIQHLNHSIAVTVLSVAFDICAAV